MIEALNVTKNYPGIKALKGVDFTLRKGEIHCLVGENGSGKSTLIKILSGVVSPERGSVIRIDGQDTDSSFNAHDAIAQGIRVIYQDLALFPNLTVRENISFQSVRERGGWGVRLKEQRHISRRALEEIGVDIDPERAVGTLSIAEQQLVEIARALIGDVRLLVLDEPTASLTRKEVDALFAVIHKMHLREITILFVSHKLNEIFEIAEEVTVLRDGVKIGSFPPHELDHEKLTYLMTAKKISRQPPPPIKNYTALLEVRNLCKRNNYADISFTLHAGEIIGVTGLLGSGRSEMAQSIFGMNPVDSGSIRVEGRDVRLRSNHQALRMGIGYVPENRITEGIIAEQSILDNITVTVWERACNNIGLLSREQLTDIGQKWVGDLDIKLNTLGSAANTLSGGNQQKIVLAKWLATNPKILILDEPTVGIDVFAKDSVHRLIKSLSAQGIGIIMISDEIPEVLSSCHRIFIMRRGRIVYTCDAEGASADELLARCSVE